MLSSDGNVCGVVCEELGACGAEGGCGSAGAFGAVRLAGKGGTGGNGGTMGRVEAKSDGAGGAKSGGAGGFGGAGAAGTTGGEGGAGGVSCALACVAIVANSTAVTRMRNTVDRVFIAGLFSRCRSSIASNDRGYESSWTNVPRLPGDPLEVPQGLKPLIVTNVNGTTEVVPSRFETSHHRCPLEPREAT